VRDRTAIRLVLVTDRAQAVDPSARVALDAVPGAQDFEAFHADAPTTDPASRSTSTTTSPTSPTPAAPRAAARACSSPTATSSSTCLQFAQVGSGAVRRLDEQGGLVLDQVGPPEEYPTRLGTGISINLTPVVPRHGHHRRAEPAGAHRLHHRAARAVRPGRLPRRRRALPRHEHGRRAPLFAALLRHPDFATRDLSSVRLLSSGAAPLPVEMIQGLQRRLGEDVVIAEGYGLTEVTMGATIGPGARSAVRKAGTVGPPVPDTEVRIVDPAGGELEPLPVGEPGEVVIRGPQVMLGYKDRPDDTAATLVDGWLRTGDIGTLDDDGYLTIVDRKKDMLIYKGYNVYPRDLEELLHAQPGVVGAAVVGRPTRRSGSCRSRSSWPPAPPTARPCGQRSTHGWCPTSSCASCTWSTPSRCRRPARCSSASCASGCRRTRPGDAGSLTTPGRTAMEQVSGRDAHRPPPRREGSGAAVPHAAMTPARPTPPATVAPPTPDAWSTWWPASAAW
jgi:long-chain acyl-CoA synthetase